MALMIAATALAAIGTSSAAAEPSRQREVSAVVACRTQADEQARLRCYDAAVGALANAAASGSIVVVDREDLRKTRRSLFGFSVPKLPFFSGDKSQNEEQEEVVTTIKSVRGLGHGKWQLDLDTAGIWQMAEGSSLMKTPKPGESIKIKKAALGSYFITVENRRALKGFRIR